MKTASASSPFLKGDRGGFPELQIKIKGNSVKQFFFQAFIFLLLPSLAKANDPTQWPVVGSNNAGQRFSPLKQITPENVKNLAVAEKQNKREIFFWAHTHT